MFRCVGTPKIVRHIILARYLYLSARQDARIRRIKVRDQIMLLGEGSEDVVAQAKIEREPMCRAPVILNVFANFPIAILGRRQGNRGSSPK